MSYEIQTNGREAQVDLLEQEDSNYKIRVDGETREIDVVEVADGIYSVLMNGRSFNVELKAGSNHKKYTINANHISYDVEVVDAETKYQRSRNKDDMMNNENHLISPVPGKVIDVTVSVGDEVHKGQTLVVLSAMKMESEFKAAKDAVVKEIKIEKGQNVESNQILVVTE